MHDRFKTLHEIASGFAKSEQTVRRAFKQLIKTANFKEGDDFLKDDYVDDPHFLYKINPERFMAEYQKQPDQPPLVIKVDNKSDNKMQPVDTKLDTKLDNNLDNTVALTCPALTL